MKVTTEVYLFVKVQRCRSCGFCNRVTVVLCSFSRNPRKELKKLLRHLFFLLKTKERCIGKRGKEGKVLSIFERLN